jgi:pimeloyl-ACP methyl ester carboxylesterase
MVTPSPDFVSTDIGQLHVRRTGVGPPVVLWHSLFVDSQSWGPLIDELARQRTVYAIDGPSHGKSDSVPRDFTFDEVAAAAVQTLDRLGLTEPVDWVGNAWGGHIGFRLATAERPRLRSLVTIGTPIEGFTRKEKLTKVWPLVELYRFVGPSKFLVNTLSDALLGADAVAEQPGQAAVIMDSFRAADRKVMLHAMRSMMLQRNGIAQLLPDVSVPTLVMSARDDVTGWRPDEARETCAAIPDCRVEVVAGTGHIAPLLVDRDRILSLITDFWAATDRSQPAK